MDDGVKVLIVEANIYSSEMFMYNYKASVLNKIILRLSLDINLIVILLNAMLQLK